MSKNISRMNFRDRLARLAAECGPDACWLWPGHLTPDGYVKISWQGRTGVFAHRAAYELLVGPIPEGHQLDHVRTRGCIHRHCLNPAHAEPVTQQENIRRSDGLTNQHAQKTHCPRDHAYAEHARMYEGRRYCRECARIRTLQAYHERKLADPAWYERRMERQRARYARLRADGE